MLAAALASVALIAPMQEPAVQTGAATGITSTSVTVNATVDGFGELTRYWFQYGTSTGYGGGTASLTETDPSAIPVSVAITGLAPSTTYHYRIVAQNLDAELHGADETFTTLSTGCTTPQASTAAATAISATRAALHGTVSATCGPAQYSFEYGTTTGYGKSTALVSGTGPVSAAVSGLRPGTMYHFRLVAANGAGTSDGADRTFTTPKPISTIHAPRNVRARAVFTVTARLRAAAAVTIELVHKGKVFKRLRLGRRTGSVHAHLTAPGTTGVYEIWVLANGDGTTQTDRLRLTVS